MGPSRAHGPSAEPAEANGLPKAHGPAKVQWPRGRCIPLPPSRRPCLLPSKLNLRKRMLGSHLHRSRSLKGVSKTTMVYQVIVIDL